MTAVTCPIMRYHPAIIAQAAATVGVMSDGRFTLGRVRRLTSMSSQPVVRIVERHERLGEALDIIQGLLAGEITSYRGRHLQLDHARLFDRPRRKPAVVVAAGPEAARLAGEQADGLMVTEAKRRFPGVAQGRRQGTALCRDRPCCGR